jgi:hypothetical protein
MGARARAESLRVAEAIRNNFDYVHAAQQLHRPKTISAESTVCGALPGIYDRETQEQDRTATSGFHRGGR